MLNFIENINSTTMNKNIIDYAKVDVKMTNIMDLNLNNYCARIGLGWKWNIECLFK